VVSAETALAERLGGRRFTTAVTLVFAGLALLIASIGLYGVVALTVNQRTYELGVRVALGAAPAAIRNMMIRDAFRRVAAGIGLGLVVLVVLARMLRAFLSEPVWDPAVFAAVAVVIAATGLVASWIPARRGSRLDPVTAIRADHAIS
jgi:putative ABC transport system permease protein